VRSAVPGRRLRAGKWVGVVLAGVDLVQGAADRGPPGGPPGRQHDFADGHYVAGERSLRPLVGAGQVRAVGSLGWSLKVSLSKVLKVVRCPVPSRHPADGSGVLPGRTGHISPRGFIRIYTARSGISCRIMSVD
jgi:hypothetical protein